MRLIETCFGLTTMAPASHSQQIELDWKERVRSVAPCFIMFQMIAVGTRVFTKPPIPMFIPLFTYLATASLSVMRLSNKPFFFPTAILRACSGVRPQYSKFSFLAFCLSRIALST